MVFILYIILGFFLGSIPFGLIVGKLWLGTDVRQQGSGNIGMTNVMRIGGKGPGILTFILDFAKGWLAVFLAGMTIIPDETDPSSPILFLSLVAASAVCGHIFSIFLHFRGGKGPWVQNISFSGYQFMIMFALSGLMIYKHRENIGRLLSGQEGKLKSETRSEETK